MRKQFLKLCFRWGFNSLGLFLASAFLNGVTFDDGLAPIIIAGLVLALVNAVIKPVVLILSLPIILLSLGLFVFFINGFMVFIADALYGGIQIDGFFVSLLAGAVIGLVNYIATIILEK